LNVVKDPSIAVIDYGAGNLRSVAKAFEKLGYSPKVTNRAADILSADGLVLPGVGAAGEAMRRLGALGLTEAIRTVIARGRPFFGVCLGLQMLFESSEEDSAECLGILPGKVERLPQGLKVPHMGWNQVHQREPHPLFRDIPQEANFYFVHSYYAQPLDTSLVLGETDYGVRFGSALGKDNLVATQFHPEKSGELGLMLYRNFVTHMILGAA